MAIDATNVIVGAPDQSATVGAVNWAAVGTTLPTDARTALPSGWTKGGYVSSDGVTLSIEQGTTSIPDWSLGTVRTLLEDAMLAEGLPGYAEYRSKVRWRLIPFVL